MKGKLRGGMADSVWLLGLFLTAMVIPNDAITNHKNLNPVAHPPPDFVEEIVPGPNEEEECSARVENALGNLSNRRSGSMLDLTGYALHQSLRSVPYDMYVTDMRVKVPGSWGKVDRCRFDSDAGMLQTRVLFKDLSITGSVKLYEDLVKKQPPTAYPSDKCNMTVRMRRAGLGFTVTPSPLSRSARQMTVTTATTFVEPQFISVHAYGCKSGSQLRRRSDAAEPRLPEEKQLEMTQEMEDVFLRGVRSLITRYMEHQLQPVLRDTLMLNLGYTISYGR